MPLESRCRIAPMRLNARLSRARLPSWVAASVFMAVVFLLINTPASGQTGTVIGLVEDSQGGVLPGATVSLAGPSAGSDRQAVAGASGTFALRDVPVGIYVIKVTMPGFRSVQRPGVRVDATRPVDLGTIALVRFEKPGAHYVYSKLNDATWVSSVSQAEIDASPEWKENADGALLSPNAAIRSARTALGQVMADANHWSVSGVTLRPVGWPIRGVYEVVFVQPPGLLNGSAPTLTILVLMNGEAMVPRRLEPDETLFGIVS
jgi:hypothetical protein